MLSCYKQKVNNLRQAWLAQLPAQRLADPEIQVQTPPGAYYHEYIFWTNWLSVKPGLTERPMNMNMNMNIQTMASLYRYPMLTSPWGKTVTLKHQQLYVSHVNYCERSFRGWWNRVHVCAELSGTLLRSLAASKQPLNLCIKLVCLF